MRRRENFRKAYDRPLQDGDSRACSELRARQERLLVDQPAQPLVAATAPFPGAAEETPSRVPCETPHCLQLSALSDVCGRSARLLSRSALDNSVRVLHHRYPSPTLGKRSREARVQTRRSACCSEDVSHLARSNRAARRRAS